MTYLVHHGILGQKWGIRRYQNPDGTLTEAGKKRNARKLNRAVNNEWNFAKRDRMLQKIDPRYLAGKIVDEHRLGSPEISEKERRAFIEATQREQRRDAISTLAKERLDKLAEEDIQSEYQRFIKENPEKYKTDKQKADLLEALRTSDQFGFEKASFDNPKLWEAAYPYLSVEGRTSYDKDVRSDVNIKRKIVDDVMNRYADVSKLKWQAQQAMNSALYRKLELGVGGINMKEIEKYVNNLH